MSINWTFQGGKRVIKTIAATAGDAVANLSPGTGKRWLVLRGRLTLVADANAANRYVNLRLTDGTNVVEGIGQLSTAIVANETKILDFGEVRFMSGAAIAYDSLGYLGFNPILLEGADQFRIEIVGGLAGDSYSGYVVVLEIDI